MKEVERIKSFVESVGYEKTRCGCLDREKGLNPFVTISRQTGAGGNNLGNEILKELHTRSGTLFQGWERLNQELCHKIAEEAGGKGALHNLLHFECRSGIEDMMDSLILGTEPQDKINRKIFDLIRNLALLGKVIIIGRGGVCLTRHLPLGIHIRLVAPFEVRVQRVKNLMRLEAEKAKEFILKRDESRARLMKNYFNRAIEDPLLYDAVWNTGTVPMDQIARTVVSMIESKACACRQRPLF